MLCIGTFQELNGVLEGLLFTWKIGLLIRNWKTQVILKFPNSGLNWGKKVRIIGFKKVLKVMVVLIGFWALEIWGNRANYPLGLR